MSAMILILLGAAPAPNPAAAEFKIDGAMVRVRVHAHVYSYDVVNVDCEPITSFEVGQCNGYYPNVPTGWQSDLSGTVFRCWTDDPSRAIFPGLTKTFSYRVSSDGAVLGRVAARLHRGSTEIASLDGVWGAIPEPLAHRRAIILTLIVIFGLHAFLVRRRLRGNSPSSPR